MADPVVRYEAHEKVSVITLNRPEKLNAIDAAQFDGLRVCQTIKLLLAEGNLVAVWTTYEGTQQGPLGPFPLPVARHIGGGVPHRGRKDRRVVGDLGQHADPQGTRPSSKWLR